MKIMHCIIIFSVRQGSLKHMNYMINVVTLFSEVVINIRQTDLSSFSEDLHTTIFMQYDHHQCTPTHLIGTTFRRHLEFNDYLFSLGTRQPKHLSPLLQALRQTLGTFDCNTK